MPARLLHAGLSHAAARPRRRARAQPARSALLGRFRAFGGFELRFQLTDAGDQVGQVRMRDRAALDQLGGLLPKVAVRLRELPFRLIGVDPACVICTTLAVASFSRLKSFAPSLSSAMPASLVRLFGGNGLCRCSPPSMSSIAARALSCTARRRSSSDGCGCSRRLRPRRLARPCGTPRASASAPRQDRWRPRAPCASGGRRSPEDERPATPSQVRRRRIRGRCYSSVTSRLAPRRSFPTAPAREADSDRGKENRERERVRNPTHARSGTGRGAPDRDRVAHARAGREERRNVALARRVGPAAARLRDRPQVGRRVPPAPVRRAAGDARRDHPRPEDHRRRHAPHGHSSRQGRRPRRAAAAPARPRSARATSARAPPRGCARGDSRPRRQRPSEAEAVAAEAERSRPEAGDRNRAQTPTRRGVR